MYIINEKANIVVNNIGRNNLDFWDFLPVVTSTVVAGVLGILTFKIIEDGN